MKGKSVLLYVKGIGKIKGMVVKVTKEYMFIRGGDKKVTAIRKIDITMFQVEDSNPYVPIYVYGIKQNGKDIRSRFFRVGKMHPNDEKVFLKAIAISGEAYLLGELNDLSEEEIKKSLDGTITGDY